MGASLLETSLGSFMIRGSAKNHSTLWLLRNPTLKLLCGNGIIMLALDKLKIKAPPRK
jgi:hypothetical protein